MSTVTVTKTLAAKFIDPAPGEETPAGWFRALISVYGVTDHEGDVVEPGAFRKTILEWELAKGTKTMPVVWSHQYFDLKSFLGVMTRLESTDEGLIMEGVIDLDTEEGRRIYKLMKDGVITEFSWSGMVREYELIEDDDSWWPSIKIKDVDLWEAGPCFKGANPETELLSVKADGRVTGQLTRDKGRALTKAGRDRLAAVQKTIETILAADIAEENPAAKEAPPPPAEPAGEAPSAGQAAEDHQQEKDSTTPGSPGGDDTVSRALLELITTASSD